MNNFLNQIKSFWNELGLNQKVTLSVAALGIIGVMSAVIMWSGKPDFQLLYGRMDAQDMADVVEHLDQNAIPYKLSAGGGSISVPAERVAKVRMELATQGIPQGGSVGYEIFDRGNFGISDFIQRTNYVRAIQGELSRTIAQLQGVKSARVMVVMPENKLLVNNVKSRATASVFVETGGHSIGIDAVNSIRFLVANSVEGLLLEDVAVVDHRGNVLTEALQETGIAGTSGQLKYRQELELYFTAKVESMLGAILGPDSVVARVSVDVDTEAHTKVDRIFDPEGQVVRNQTQTEDSMTTSETRSGQQAVAGVAGNIPAAQIGGGEAGPTSTTQEVHKNKNIAYEINESTIETVKTPGGINNITASVFIAMAMQGEGEAAKPLSRGPEEIAQLKQMVVNALGVSNNGMLAEVSIQEMPFKVESPVVAMAGGPSFVDSLTPWMEFLRPVGGLALAAFIFLVFLRLIKKHKSESIAFEKLNEEETKSSGSGFDFENTPLTPEALTQLIQQKPENISLALKNWVSSENK